MNCGAQDSTWYDVGNDLDYDCSVTFRKPDEVGDLTVALNWLDGDDQSANNGNVQIDMQSDGTETARYTVMGLLSISCSHGRIHKVILRVIQAEIST